MKWTYAIVAVVLALIVSAALYSRSIDPRPAGLAMRELLSAAVEETKQRVSDPVDFALLSDSYAALARRFAQAELTHGSDADLRLYAQRLLDRPAPAEPAPRRFAATFL